MTINSNFDLHIETIKRDAKNIFDHSGYDSILHAAKILFGDKCVTYNEKDIFIKDNVTIHLSLSWNEQKAYIYTYFDCRMMTGEQPTNADDINYKLMDINSCFRLFGVKEIIEYLQMKEIENRWIRNNEG